VPLLFSYGVSGFSFLAGTPYAVLDWGAFSTDFLGQYHYGERPWFAQDVLPTWWMQLATLFQGFGVLPMVLVALGSAAR